MHQLISVARLRRARGKGNEPSNSPGRLRRDERHVVVRHAVSIDRGDPTSSARDRARRDTEILERLLAPTGPLAPAFAQYLIERFVSLGGVIGASSKAVADETSDEVVGLLDAHRAFLEHSLRDRLLDAPITASGTALNRYLIATMGDIRSERMRALYLDGGNRLIADEVIADGDPVGLKVSTRSVLNRALELHAAALILVHNHPGGSAEPSREDIVFTQRLAEAGRLLSVRLHDHLIVCGSICTSLRVRGVFQ